MGKQPVGRAHPLFDDYTRLVAPPVTPGDYGFPIMDEQSVELAAAKYRRLKPNYDPLIFERACGLTLEMYRLQMAGSRPGKMTLQQVVDSIDLRKSPGWPWTSCRSHCHMDKRSALNDPVIAQWLVDSERSYYTPQPIEDVATAFLKKELRPMPKCGIGDARCVFGAGLLTVLVGCTFNKEFDVTLFSRSDAPLMGEGFSVVGMSPFRRSFDRLANAMRDFNFHEMDGSSWDTCMFPELFRAVYAIRADICGYMGEDLEAFNRYRDTLYDGLIVLPNNRVVFHQSGNLSGQPGTTPDNTIASGVVNCYLIIRVQFEMHWRSCALGADRKEEYVKIIVLVNGAWLREHVRMLHFGDDNDLGIHKRIAHDIHRHAYLGYVELGFKFSFTEPCPLTELRLLNYGWEKNFGIWLPSSDAPKLLASLKMGNFNDDGSYMRPHHVIDRVSSIWYLSYGNQPLFKWVGGYLGWLLEKHPGYPNRHTILTVGAIHELFTSESVRTVNISDDFVSL